jgi:SAM-dependent methyltransferase
MAQESNIEPRLGPDPYNLDAMTHAHNYNAWLAQQAAKALGEKATILDFGAGTGNVADAFRLLTGNAPICLEPDPSFRQQLQARGFRVVTAEEISPGSVDGAYTMNVLEHIEDDVAALSTLRGMLRPGARMYAFVPAYQILFSDWDRAVGHMRRYSCTTLQQSVEGAGFRVIASRYSDSLGFFVTLGLKLSGLAKGAISSGSVRVYDRFGFPVSLAFDRLANRVVGKNAWIVAEKV